METYYPMLKDAAGMFLFLGIELSVLFILISAGVSLLQQYIPDSKVQSILSGSGGRGYVLAALLGSVTPFCSCSTIPMLRGLLKAKAGFGPTLTFLFTSPLLNPIIVGLFIATFGIKVTVLYVTVALLVSIVAGIALAQMNFEQYVIPEGEIPVASACCSGGKHEAPMPATPSTSSCCAPVPTTESIKAPSLCCMPIPPATPSCCGGTPLEVPRPATDCCGSAPQELAASCCQSAAPQQVMTFWFKVRLAFCEAWAQFRQVFPYLLLGVSLGALIYGFVPSEFIAEHASGDSIFAVPIAAVIGIPLYVRAEALIPLSVVLVGKGMGLGAVMALIIGGGGASLTEVILLKSMFRMPMIIAFLAVILGMAIVAGYLFQFIL